MSKEHAWINQEWCNGMADFIDEKEGNSPTSFAMRAIGTHIAAQAANIELLRAECRAYRALTFHLPLTSENFGLRDAVNAARAAVDSAHALEDK